MTAGLRHSHSSSHLLAARFHAGHPVSCKSNGVMIGGRYQARLMLPV